MLKKIAKRIIKEMEQAKDYVDQAYLVCKEHRDLGDLFISLAGEEIDHAERLFKAGYNMINDHKDNLYKMDEKSEEDAMHFERCKAIWDWTHRLYAEEITDLKYKVSNFKR